MPAWLPAETGHAACVTEAVTERDESRSGVRPAFPAAPSRARARTRAESAEPGLIQAQQQACVRRLTRRTACAWRSCVPTAVGTPMGAPLAWCTAALHTQCSALDVCALSCTYMHEQDRDQRRSVGGRVSTSHDRGPRGGPLWPQHDSSVRFRTGMTPGAKTRLGPRSLVSAQVSVGNSPGSGAAGWWGRSGSVGAFSGRLSAALAPGFLAAGQAAGAWVALAGQDLGVTPDQRGCLQQVVVVMSAPALRPSDACCSGCAQPVLGAIGRRPLTACIGFQLR